MKTVFIFLLALNSSILFPTSKLRSTSGISSRCSSIASTTNEELSCRLSPFLQNPFNSQMGCLSFSSSISLIRDTANDPKISKSTRMQIPLGASEFEFGSSGLLGLGASLSELGSWAESEWLHWVSLSKKKKKKKWTRFYVACDDIG